MTTRRRRLFATLLGTGLLLSMLALTLLDDFSVPEPSERFEVREVQLYQPPPPPPSPPVTARDASADLGPPLSLSPLDKVVALETMDLDVDRAAGTYSGYGDFGLGTEGLGTEGLGEGLGDGQSVVGVTELDSDPIVLSAPLYRYPAELSDEGIARFMVRFHILIDEVGKPHLIEIVDNPYPSENERLVEWLADVRFSPPLKLGIPVRTEYLWPVLYRYERER